MRKMKYRKKKDLEGLGRWRTSMVAQSFLINYLSDDIRLSCRWNFNKEKNKFSIE